MKIRVVGAQLFHGTKEGLRWTDRHTWRS